MPTVPTTIDHEGAIDRARLWVTRCLEPSGDAWFDGRAFLDRDAGHALARYVLKKHAMSHPSHMIEVCNDARAGWADAEMALFELIVAFDDRGEEPPAYLRAFRQELANPNRLRPHRPKGKQKADHLIQDIIIASMVIELIAKHGLNPTRRTLSDRPSACSIAAEALAERGIRRGTEKAIEKIWQKYGRGLMPDYLAA